MYIPDRERCRFLFGVQQHDLGNGLLLGVLGKKGRVRFQITSEGANFNPKQGWKGFFLPFCQEAPNDGKHYKTADWRFALKRIGLHQDWYAITSLFPYFTFWKRQMRTQDVFGKCRDRRSMDR